MTRKDYELIAAAIKQNRRTSPKGDIISASDFVATLAARLAEDNPRFDKQKFVEACKGE